MRFVIDHDQHAWLDPHLKAPGRGAHLCYSESCVSLAWKKKSLSASFKTAVSLPSRESFHRSFLDGQYLKITNLIGLARRRGEIISGLNMLERPSSPVHFIIFASDIAEQSQTSLVDKLCKGDGAGSAKGPFLPEEIKREWSTIFVDPKTDKDLSSWVDSLADRWSSTALGALIGKAHRVAIAVTSKDIAEQLSLEIMRIFQVLVASSTR